jgi:DNA repair exonuclease SbcCD ATPase subunit
VPSIQKDSELFTDQKLFDLFTEMNSNMSEMRNEMKHIRNDLQITKDLQRELSDINKRVTIIEEQSKGQNKVFEAIRLWGSWVIALIALTLGYIKGIK